jgi:catechol 2,3-dioxygenase-like lactoylglutathione lyase family enzyme
MKPESSVIFFPCKDINETKKYYTTVLELPIYKDLGNTVWFDCGYGYLAFVDYGPDRPLASGQCISFNLPSKESVDAMYRQLLSRPVVGLQDPPAQHPKFPVYSFFLSDPNGYTLEFQKTTD